ncbi:hypothetical protein DUT90_12770 [Polaribacter sp. WD7]|uniref:DUF6588 family protein n=1 Tax=Polaribacter sp. WD7 TaxID=2269061 RepID=UPI000DF308C8|nr:DUF6588 family protein [Polaribacter sp. WD7]RCS26616.1 hypothetical protein DUT90_12770 [Polaribacter sp. WD7]
MKKCIALFLSFFAFSLHTKAQEGFENILLADPSDSKKLLQAYFAPGMEGFINAMNSGWYHTAKVHKPFGFDISIGASGAAIPSDRDSFDIAALGLVSVSSTSTTSPTFSGSDNGAQFRVQRNIRGENVTADFTAPGGVNLPANLVPAPAVQLNVGLPGKFEVMARFIPDISFGDDQDESSLNMFGIGLKKEITNWFGPLDKTPLHVSLLAAYTSMTVSYGIADITTGPIRTQAALAEFDLSAFTVQAIASLNFPIINIYGGFGYNSGNSSYNMTGRYTGVFDTGFPAPNDTVEETLIVPSDLDFESNGVAATIGARLSLGFFKIYGSYSLQEYNTANLGVAISIR